MKTQEWTTVDKGAWGVGPWTTEPDKRQWPDPETGLPCLAVRHTEFGHWCGYVGVPESHPWYGWAYGEIPVDMDVRGGLTFSDACQPALDPARGICHVREADDPEVFWFGFDCAHAWDISPGLEARLREVWLKGPTRPADAWYRDLAHVTAECTRLARQLAERAAR